MIFVSTYPFNVENCVGLRDLFRAQMKLILPQNTLKVDQQKYGTKWEPKKQLDADKSKLYLFIRSVYRYKTQNLIL